MILIPVLLLSVGLLVVWFRIKGSPLQRQFLGDVSAAQEKLLKPVPDLLGEGEFAHLPPVMQRYLEQNGYWGKPTMGGMRIEFENVTFRRARSTPPLRMRYTQVNLVAKPTRLAMMQSTLFGVPFEGYDYYREGKGGMKGVLGKLVTLFHQTGPEMDKAALVTFLAECLLIPSTLSRGYLSFDEWDGEQASVTLRDGEVTVSGVYRFNEQAEFVSFSTAERAATMPDGTLTPVRWSIACADYQRNEQGIRIPTQIKATWHYPEGDLEYFSGQIKEIKYL